MKITKALIKQKNKSRPWKLAAVSPVACTYELRAAREGDSLTKPKKKDKEPEYVVVATRKSGGGRGAPLWMRSMVDMVDRAGGCASLEEVLKIMKMFSKRSKKKE